MNPFQFNTTVTLLDSLYKYLVEELVNQFEIKKRNL